MTSRQPAKRRGASGKPVAITIIALAIVLGTVAVGYHHLRQRRALEFWGSSAAAAILNAENVTALQLRDDGTSAADKDTIDVAGRTLRIVARRDVGQAPGFSHVRRSLVNDASFAWDKSISDRNVDWRYAVVFGDGDNEAVLLFSEDFTEAGSARTAARVDSSPVAEGLRAFFEPYFVDSESVRSAPSP